jgi:hypothetical protein
MYFIIHATDYKDKDSLQRRMRVREAHMEGMTRLKDKGILHMACARLNDQGDMCGSTLFLEMTDLSQVHAYLEIEPYITNKVWDKIEISSCLIPPMFFEK